MNINPYAAPTAALSKENADVAPPLWNPDAAGAWSLLFTPIFGSILLLKNWQAIGDQKWVKAAKIWLAVSIFMLFPSVFFPLVGLIYIIVWYFAWQRNQTRYVKERWGTDYPRKNWGLPIALGLVGNIVVSAVLIFLAALFFQTGR